MTWELTDSFIVSAELEQCWAFFSNALNLPRITPPWLHFTVATPEPVKIGDGALLDYSIRWMGVRLKWRTRIILWQPPMRFVDVQERGPYARWHHEHWFEPRGQRTLCNDRVRYRLPLGPIGGMTHALLVRRQLLGLFRYRRGVIGEVLGGFEPVQEDVTILPADCG